MLSISNLRKSFNEVRAVNNVTFNIPSGQMVGVIGRSGAGKSTLLRLINRLADPTSGSISFDGKNITELRGKELRLWRASCAMIFQQFNLIERMDVLSNVLVGRIAHHGFIPSMLRQYTDTERAMAIKALERVGMVQQALQRAGTLSGGQQQRVAIAKALVQDPKILLADEPIASLDPANATRVMNSLRTINQDDGITVLVNLHTLDTARKYCDRIIAMRDGEIRFNGAAHELSNELVRDIYGDAGLENEIDESVTSTSIARSTTQTENQQIA